MGFILIICTILILIFWVSCVREKGVKNKAKIMKLSISLLFFIIMTTYYFTPFSWKVPPNDSYQGFVKIFGSDKGEVNQKDLLNIIDAVNSSMVQRVSVINYYGHTYSPMNQKITISIYGKHSGYYSHIYLFNDTPQTSYIDCNGKDYNIKNASEIIDKITKLKIPEKIAEN